MGKMTDRELLELAAKAVGLVYHSEYGVVFGRDNCGNETEDEWNPLTDDGDALRLAVDLDIEVAPSYRGVCVNGYWHEYGTDKHAATRRAITLAAAQIGGMGDD